MNGVAGHVHLHLDPEERSALEQSAAVMAKAAGEVEI
jgi:hypothetical protein